MNISTSARRGRRTLAAVMAAAAIATMSTTVTPAVAVAQTVSVTGEQPKGKEEGLGPGKLSPLGSVEPGGLLSVSGTGLEQRPADGGFLGIKINDGSIKFTDREGSDASSIDNAGTAYFTDANLPDADGNFSGTVRVPADLTPGEYWIRVLSGNDGGNPVSKFGWFTVKEKSATTPTTPTTPAQPTTPTTPAQPTTPTTPAQPTTPTTPAAATLKVENVTTAANGSVNATVAATGFAPGATLTAKVGDAQAKFQSGRTQADTATADATGAFRGTVVIPAGKAPAGQAVELVLASDAGSANAQVTGSITAAFTNAAGAKDTSAGAKVAAVIGNLPAGAVVTAIGTEKQNWLGTTTATADATGTAKLESLTIPAAAPVGAPITVTFTVSGKQITSPAGVSVTPSNATIGEDKFTVETVDLPAGLYQSAYSKKENAVYVTQAVGRPPIKESGLTKVNADTLETIATADLAKAEDGSIAHAVYGIAVDDELGYVWVTNTRSNTVAVYKTSDLTLVKQFPADTVSHSRDVAVDPTTHKAYVTSASGDESTITVFDGTTLEAGETIDLGKFGALMSLDLDPATGDLYTVHLDHPTATRVATRDGNKVTNFRLPEKDADGASGVALDAKRKQLWVASQGSNNVLVLDVVTGKVVATVPTGAGALNAVFDPVNDLVYVSNFGGATVSVIDANTRKLVANLAAPGPSVNHVETDGRGNVYAVNKSAGGTEAAPTNKLSKITPVEKPAPTNPSPADPFGSLGALGSLGSSDATSGQNTALLGLGALGIGGLLVGALVWAAQNPQLLPFALPELPPLPFALPR